VKNVLRKHPEVLSQYLMACLGYPDCPEQDEAIYATNKEDGGGGTVCIANINAIEPGLLPKDIRLIEIAKEEKAERRKVLVFFSQTHRRDARHRVKKGLEDAGLKVVILEPTVAPDKREAWLKKAERDGFDVMLTNGRLVETGLDLIFAATIIQYGIEYCVTPETRVLTDDLRWVPAGDLKIGDGLVGFDEDRPGERRQRKTKHSHVVNTMRLQAPVWKFTMSDGTILRSSAEHRWLAIKNKKMGYDWMRAEILAADVIAGKDRWIPRVLSVDEQAQGYNEGYVAGMFDGEGHVSFPQKHGGESTAFLLGYAQNEGDCLNTVLNTLDDHDFNGGFSWSMGTDECVKVTIQGGWDESVRFLTTFRPQRLIGKFRDALKDGRVRLSIKTRELTRIVKAEFEGYQEVVSMETSSKTFFAEGFGSHNSIPVLRQSIRRSWRLGQQKDIKVIFMAYEGTMQETATSLIARKMRAAEMLDGDDVHGLSQHDEGGSNILYELANEAVKSTRISAKWAKRDSA
jgi:hypothetical protein